MHYSPYMRSNYYLPMPYMRQYPGYWGYPQVIENQFPVQVGERIEVFRIQHHGRQPFVIDIVEAADRNRNFRTAIWTGDHLQVTLMHIRVGEDIGLEIHHNVDQFLRIEEGYGFVQMGDRQNNLTYQRRVSEDDAIMVPAGTWHNITNTGNRPLKLYTIYAPPEHPFGTVHPTKADATAEDNR